MSNPLGYPNLLRTVAEMDRRIRELERRRFPNPPQNLDDLDDCQVSYGGTSSAPSAGHVLTWVAGSTPFGGIWQPAPSVAGDAAIDLAINDYTDSGIFDEGDPFEWSQDITVDANSRQLVLVTADVAISDSLILAGVEISGGSPTDLNIPTTWRLTAFDATYDPTAADIVGQNATGSGFSQVALWLTNDTDESQDNSLYVIAAGGSSFYEFDATVTVVARTVISVVTV